MALRSPLLFGALAATLPLQMALGLVPWPLPRSMATGTAAIDVDPAFIVACDTSCSYAACSSDVIYAAQKRYQALIAPRRTFVAEAATVKVAMLCISSGDMTLDQTTDESYSLTVAADGSTTIKAHSVFGTLRGLESLSHLVDTTAPGHRISNAPVSIEDGPRFGFRGLMVDTGRHFLPLAFLKHVVDGLSAAKLNVLHWHMTDSSSFPAGSKTYPQLAEQGAYAPSAVYSPEDMASLVEYARLRGVRVMPEWDMPGHGCWKGIPEINGCSDVLDPTNDKTYQVLEGFLSEMMQIFHEPLLFLGGDEVNVACWDQNPKIAAWLTSHKMTSAQLQPYFWKQMSQRVLPALNRTLSIWENDQLQIDPASVPKGTVANVYQSLATADKTVGAYGMPTVLSIASSEWYLDQECGGQYNQNAWTCIYDVKLESNVTEKHPELLLGGETAMWGEGVNEDNFDAFVWRGAYAAAERLWSPANVTDKEVARPRLSDMSCRMSMRGIRMGPVQVGFCPSDAGAARAAGRELFV